MDVEIIQAFGIALGLGMLVGMQREWRSPTIAGIRTFPLITVLGTILMFLAEEAGPWIVAAGLLGVVALVVMGNIGRFQLGEVDIGLTTEIAALVMYGVGALIAAEHIAPAVALGGFVAVLLHWKEPLHRFVERLGERDFTALMQLALIALVILPILPNETYGPYEVLNPFKIWMMVVLIVGISMVAYVAFKLVGARVGSILGGVFGGLISSTATTVSYARRVSSQPGAAAPAALVILIASTIMNVRILFEVGVVAPSFVPVVAAPIGVIMGVMLVLCGLLLLRVGRGEAENPTHESPAQFRAALIFGALYAVIIFAVAATKNHFGTQGIYVLALISGFADVDAIVLSSAELVEGGRIAANVGWRVIVIAFLSNLVFKGVLCAFLGGRRLGLYALVLFGITLAAGVALLFFWPDEWVLRFPSATATSEGT